MHTKQQQQQKTHLEANTKTMKIQNNTWLARKIRWIILSIPLI